MGDNAYRGRSPSKDDTPASPAMTRSRAASTNPFSRPAANPPTQSQSQTATADTPLQSVEQTNNNKTPVPGAFSSFRSDGNSDMDDLLNLTRPKEGDELTEDEDEDEEDLDTTRLQ